jgi:hypothetical protein
MVVAEVDCCRFDVFEIFDYAFSVLLDFGERVCVFLVRDGGVDQVERRVVDRVVVFGYLVIDFDAKSY